MSQTQIFLDTNVLVYAHDQSSQYHADSAELLSLIFADKLKGTIAEQNLIELYRILTNPVAMKNAPLSPTQVKSLIQNTYLTGRFHIAYPTEATIHKTLELAVLKNVSSAKIFDLRLAALATALPIYCFVTYNIKDFVDIEGLKAVLPKKIINSPDNPSAW
jgi:predicted nucleic acid-binding protein